MRVLHLFDKYLNTTMNWAAELMLHTPDVEQHIAAPWIVKNAYYHPGFHYHFGGWQKVFGHIPDSEWEGGWREKLVRGLESKSGWWLKNLEKLDFDVMHAHFGTLGVKALPLVQKSGKSLVVSFYGYDYEKALHVQPALRAGYERMFKQASTCIALGPATSELLQKAGCPASKISMIPLAVNTHEITFISNKARGTPMQFVQVSSFTEKKGQMDTVVAFHQALRAGLKAELTLIGETVEPHIELAVREYINREGLQGPIRVEGFTENRIIRKRLQDFDVFIHPSHKSAKGDTEGLPVAILEALASGLPVISTYHADIPSAVQQGSNGYLTEPRDTTALTSAILRIAQLPAEQFEQMRLAARQSIIHQFEIRKVAADLRECYGRLVNSTR